MAFKDLCLIFISKRMQKSPWIGVQRKYTQRREAASLHQAAVSRMGLGDHPPGGRGVARLVLRPEALPGCAGQSQGPAGSAGCWVLGEVSFIVTGPESTPGFPPVWPL